MVLQTNILCITILRLIHKVRPAPGSITIDYNPFVCARSIYKAIESSTQCRKSQVRNAIHILNLLIGVDKFAILDFGQPVSYSICQSCEIRNEHHRRNTKMLKVCYSLFRRVAFKWARLHKNIVLCISQRCLNLAGLLKVGPERLDWSVLILLMLFSYIFMNCVCTYVNKYII